MAMPCCAKVSRIHAWCTSLACVQAYFSRELGRVTGRNVWLSGEKQRLARRELTDSTTGRRICLS